MKRSDYSGFSQVFKYTLGQSLKAKSFVVTMLIMVLVIAIGFPVLNIVNNSKDEVEETKIETVYVNDSTGFLANPAEAVADSDIYKNVKFERETKKLEEFEKDVEAYKKDNKAPYNNVFLVADITEETGGFSLKLYRDGSSDVSSEDASALGEILRQYVEDAKVDLSGVSAETLEMLNKSIMSADMDSDTFLGNESKDIIGFNDYNVVYAFLMIAYMIICISAGMISAKVIEEKANRVVEYLMTNVRPMALILGKVCAMALLACGQIAIYATVGFVANSVSAKVLGTETSSSLSNFISMDAIKNLSPLNVSIIVVLMALGILGFGLLSGLSAATVSKMEELGQASKGYMLVIMVGFFMSLAACEMMWTAGINTFVKVTYYLPFTSVFVLPGAILIGKVKLWQICISIAIEVVFCYVILRFVSLVYESVIVMNSGVVKTKEVIAIAKAASKAKKSRKAGV